VPEALELIGYALFAAASPVVLLATLAVLGTKHARVNGMVFSAAFILGQAAGLGIPLLVGVIVVSDSGDNGDASTWLELAFGLLMLLAAARINRKRSEPIPAESRSARLLVMLERVTPKTAFSIGVALGVGAKRLLIAILAASVIALDATSRGQEFQQAAYYVVFASVLAWLPVTIYFVVGQSADAWVTDAKRWLLENQREVSMYIALIFGLLFSIDAVVKLLT
jgi:hypothetical protein